MNQSGGTTMADRGDAYNDLVPVQFEENVFWSNYFKSDYFKKVNRML